MADKAKQLKSSKSLSTSDAEAIRCLEQAIISGKHWYLALLEAIGQWGSVEENHNGRVYRYLIAGEAFDWLLLSERLCQAIDGFLPEDEMMSLLFYGKPPIELNTDEFKKLIGSQKYQRYLNYFYGITAEEALVQVVEDEVRKERQALGRNNEQNIADEVYCRIYGTTQLKLLRYFRREKGYPRKRSIGLAELKEFTYWLFKYRLKNCDKARVASDTKKALRWLKSNASSFQDDWLINPQPTKQPNFSAY